MQRRLRAGRLRHQKALPDFTDRFGWCTWDAFYQEVSPEKVREGLESFAAGGAVVARRDAPDACVVTLRAGGDFRAWSEHSPQRVRVNGREVPFAHRPRTGALTVRLEATGRQRVRIEWR